MRRAQPTFVVEYKGDRRQKRPLKSSIWGDMDFKSLAREIEADLHEEVGQSDAGETTVPGTTATVPAEPVSRAPSSDDEGADGEVSSSAETARGSGPDQDDHGAAPVLSAGDLPSTPDPADGRRELPSPGAFATRAMLEALETENIELRRRLARKLESENLCLKAMLERFHLKA